MAVSVGLSPIPILQFFDNTGKPAVGGSLLTQVGGVNYPTYSDPNGTIALPNPIPLNSRGEVSTAAGTSTTVFLQQGVSYTLTLSDINSNQLWSIGNIVSNQLTIPYASTSGTNSIVATFSPALTSLYDGLTVNVKLANTTTASPTFNPNGLGALNVYYSDGVTQWLAGSGIANTTYTLIYNSSLNSNAGGWEVQNPSRITGSATLTLATGWATTPTGTVNYSILPDGKTAYAYFASALTATSNAQTFAVTGWPTILQPTTTKRVSVQLEDNTVVATTQSALIINGGSGTINGAVTVGGNAGFTTAGTKGFIAGTEFSFTLD